ncbi:MAG: hypothetical protein ACYSWO_10535 [Planctomycetota bacterium]
MKPNRYNSGTGRVMLVSTMLALLALGATGCASSRGIQVVPLGNRSVLTLTADEVVQVMRAAGFSDEQIYQHGTAVRDGLARSGAVQVKINGTVEAVFAINGDTVYVSTRLRGHFQYNVQTGWVNSGQVR